MQLVHHQHALVGAARADLDAGVGSQRGDVVRRHLFDQVDLAALERRDGAVGVRQVEPFDAVELALLAAGKTARRFAARHVVRVAHEDRLVARHPFVALEDEGAGTHYLGQRRGGRHLGQPLRQDHRRKARWLGQRIEHHAEGLLEREREIARVGRLPLGTGVAHGAAQAVARPPALQRGDGVGRGDRAAVREFEAGTQGEAPLLAVPGTAVLLHHLRLRLAARVLREQRVVHHVAEVARDVGGGEGRVEDLQVGMGHDLEGLGLRQRGKAGARQGEDARREGGEQGTIQCHLRVSVVVVVVVVVANRQGALRPRRRRAATWAGAPCGRAGS